MHTVHADNILDRAIGLALGIAVGDAKGIPYENLTRQQVIDLKNDRRINNNEKEVLFAQVSGLNPYIPKDWPPSRWTDDTQLSLAMMRAITKFIGGDDLMDSIVNEHIAEWQESTAGWGGTKTAIERLAKGTHTYADSGNVANGNGVLMKLAPLAFFYSICGGVDDQDIERVCRMTHTTPVALSTACTFVHLYMHLFEKSVEPLDFLKYALELTLKYEAKYSLTEQNQLLSCRINSYINALSVGFIDESILIEISNGGTYFCVDSLTMIIGLIVTSPKGQVNFETIIRAAEIGGDTDSNAAMIGALVGGMKGSNAIDQEHVSNVYRTDYVRSIAHEFGMAIVEQLTKNNVLISRKD